MKLFQKILVATDFSPHAAAALRLACELAKTCDASLCLVHAYDLIPYALPEGMPLYDAATLARLREDLARQLAQAREEALKAGVKQVEVSLVQGQPAQEIVRLAEGGYSLIVVGTHGRTGIAHILLGSVAERVVRKAPCPVITVPLVEARGSAREQKKEAQAK
jgi:nucleotide-binding universal stress UspA family protein